MRFIDYFFNAAAPNIRNLIMQFMYLLSWALLGQKLTQDTLRNKMGFTSFYESVHSVLFFFQLVYYLMNSVFHHKACHVLLTSL